MSKKGIYLAGGGARGAYQAGVLKAISTILDVKEIPFQMVSGVSVGSLNAAVLAENALDFPAATEKLATLWNEVSCDQIFNASNYQLSKTLLRNLSHVFMKQSRIGHLLDTSPLKEFIKNTIDFESIEYHIQKRHLETMEVLVNSYETYQTISFYQHYSDDFTDWNNPRHSSQATVLDVKHLLASSSLPLFFPPVQIDDLYYGDGSLGLVSPLRGAIRFKLDKILILGTRQPAILNEIDMTKPHDIGFARILGSMLNGLFIDNLDRDIETVTHMNEIARLLSIWKKRHSPWRPIQILYLQPSKNISSIAQAQYNTMPTLLRFMLNVLGAKSHSGDLLSFLLFDSGFAKQLVDLGYEDTMAAKKAVLEFFDD